MPAPHRVTLLIDDPYYAERDRIGGAETSPPAVAPRVAAAVTTLGALTKSMCALTKSGRLAQYLYANGAGTFQLMHAYEDTLTWTTVVMPAAGQIPGRWLAVQDTSTNVVVLAFGD